MTDYAVLKFLDVNRVNVFVIYLFKGYFLGVFTKFKVKTKSLILEFFAKMRIIYKTSIISIIIGIRKL